MRLKGVLILLLILSAQLILGGCTKMNIENDSGMGTGKAAQDSSKGSGGDEARGSGTELKKQDFSNSGVVNETVVDIFREPDIQSERVTQSIFNQPVRILGEKDNWIKVTVMDGYTGWVKSRYIDRDCTSIDSSLYKSRIIITNKTKKIYSRPVDGLTVKDVVLGTELYCAEKKENWCRVVLPGKKEGWVEAAGMILLASDEPIARTTAVNFTDTAKKFLKTVYLWGGVSASGIDCSGLTYICSRINGITLPRDADQQYKAGKEVPIDQKNFCEGDLLFFSADEKHESVTHVGIYIGDGRFLHASKQKSNVMISKVSESYYAKRLMGARRIF